MIKILGYTYTVDRSKTVEELGAMGSCTVRSLTIRVANDMHPQQQQSTLLHEILEALNYSLELKLDHHVLTTLEASLYQTLSDNGVDLAPLDMA